MSLSITESGGNVAGKEVQRLKKRNLQLEEENNLLRLKIEVLLDMVSDDECGKLCRLNFYTVINLIVQTAK